MGEACARLARCIVATIWLFTVTALKYAAQEAGIPAVEKVPAE
jgi:hypothetical protein